MTWDEIRKGHLNEWVIVEAIREAADSVVGSYRLRPLVPPKVSSLALRGYFRDPRAAMQEFCRLCQQEQDRELYVVPAALHRLDLDAPLRR